MWQETRETTSRLAEGDSAVAEKTGKNRKKEEKKPEEQEKRLSGDDKELATIDMMKSQQESIQRSEENDESVFKALLKSRAEAQRQHQYFFVSVLGKLRDVSASKDKLQLSAAIPKKKREQFTVAKRYFK